MCQDIMKSIVDTECINNKSMYKLGKRFLFLLAGHIYSNTF